jgi:hypothetical protein
MHTDNPLRHSDAVTPEPSRPSAPIITFTGKELQFENPDYVQPETQFTVPVSGQRDLVVARRLLVSPATFTPPLDDPNPAGLEHWTITVLPEEDAV